MAPVVQRFYRTFKVQQYRAHITAILIDGKVVELQNEWTPHVPKFTDKRLLEQYDRKRNHAYTALAKKIGGPIVIMDEDGAIGILPDGKQERIYSK